MKPLPVHEYFHAFQGEGVHSGRPAYFIRTFGCPIHCPWCDSAGTWHPDHVPANIQRWDEDRITKELIAARHSDFIVVTGGEPTIHKEALEFLIQRNRLVGNEATHIETAGHHEPPEGCEWLTLSPKWDGLPLNERALARCDEIKLIIHKDTDIKLWERYFVEKTSMHTWDWADHVWLHPEWSQRHNVGILDAISRAVKNRNTKYRAGWQLHKLYNCDQLDKNSRPLVPLGGDPALGH